MTLLEARLRRRFCRERQVTVLIGGEVVFDDDFVVKVRRRGSGIRIWSLYASKWDPGEVSEVWFPIPDEVRFS